MLTSHSIYCVRLTILFFLFSFVCSAGTRTFVHEKIFDAFVAEATRLAKERTVGCPFDANVKQGIK